MKIWPNVAKNLIILDFNIWLCAALQGTSLDIYSNFLLKKQISHIQLENETSNSSNK